MPPPRSNPWLVAVSLVALHLTHPLTWGPEQSGTWVPAAGVGLALVAWFGPRACWLVAGDGLLVVLQAALCGTLFGTEASGSSVLVAIGNVLLGTAELRLAWWAYHQQARGARGLADPRSAILFLLLVPGLACGTFALARALLFWPCHPEHLAFGPWLATLWVGRALGLVVIAPPLLASLTPVLLRRGLAVPEVVDETESAYLSSVGADHLAFGDGIEIAGLSLGACFLGCLLALGNRGPDLNPGQLWGAPLLLIIWASLRQGLRGGTIVAGIACGLPLLLPGRARGDLGMLLLQGNLLAQCATTLLVAASANWIRLYESRYRQVVGNIPVIVYSARVLGPVRDGQPPPVEITLVSAASASLLGFPPDQLLGDYERWLEHIHPEDRVLVQAAVAQLGRQEKPVTCEYRLAGHGADAPAPADSPVGPTAHLSGRVRRLPPERWVRDTLAPCFDPAGHLLGWEGVITEITEQRTLADDLRRTTGMFHALVANLPAGVFFVQGMQGRPILINARARQLLGQREDLSASLEHLARVYRLMRPDGSPYPVEELPVYQAVRRGRTTACADIVVHRPDGRRIPLVSWAAPVNLAGQGAPDAAVWVLEDLSVLQPGKDPLHRPNGPL